MTVVVRNPRCLERYWDRWRGSAALRDLMRETMREWGQCQRGGMPALGYPSVNVLGVRTPGPDDSWPDFVHQISDDMSLMLLQRPHQGRHTALNTRRMVVALQRRFAQRGTVKRHAAAMKVSDRHFTRLVDEGMFRLWVLHQI